ncbi:hypothetical protein IQ251_19125 [Saccharopolyspora sp. HNM0983]|uniref:Uncharacterized protein n=1 Tax=Saccharopolyspora montiporae TaxID=2781240 RepID=A0A929G273_9PSEU|nr:hypothetical protein [Saccharopolyspora sp. HNM0983]MBE9376567.1 hypothetical protein [Saccharopolyspora sp. HNM0983]
MRERQSRSAAQTLAHSGEQTPLPPSGSGGVRIARPHTAQLLVAAVR